MSPACFIVLFAIATVSCNPVPYRLGAGGIGVLVDGQAGLCMCRSMGLCTGWCMGLWCMGDIHLFVYTTHAP